VLVGHFGSGKTEIALNGALGLVSKGLRVTLADLDVVKPYFRSRAARAILADAGIPLLAPTGEHVYADLPIIVPQIRQALRDPSQKLIADVGGDDTGARVLGSMSDVVPPDESDCLVVLNFRRPSTTDPAEAVAMVRAIEAVSRVPVTGLVSNTHLMAQTDAEIVLDGYRMARDTAQMLGVPVVAVTVAEDVAESVPEAELDSPLLVLRRIVLPPFEQSHHQRTSGPLFVVN
jgi:Mrp family chromosome partitioning ATPase